MSQYMTFLIIESQPPDCWLNVKVIMALLENNGSKISYPSLYRGLRQLVKFGYLDCNRGNYRNEQFYKIKNYAVAYYKISTLNELRKRGGVIGNGRR